jgi:hypothetical protein
MKSRESVGHPGRSFVFREDEVARAVGFSLSDEEIRGAKYLKDILAARTSRKRELEYEYELENERKEKEMRATSALL